MSSQNAVAQKYVIGYKRVQINETGCEIPCDRGLFECNEDK